MWYTPRHLQIPFFQSHPNFSYCTCPFFLGKFAKECTIVGLVYPVWQINTGITVEFVIMWSLDLSLLSEFSWIMRLDNISSLSSASAANLFNFWSKVEFFCDKFFLHALLKFNLDSLDVVVAEPSVHPAFFFLLFLTSFWRAFGQPFSSVLFYLNFLPTSAFPQSCQ